MHRIFFAAGTCLALICAIATYGALFGPVSSETMAKVPFVQIDHWNAVAVALGAGIMSAVLFSAGAIIDTLRRRATD